jgi:hypothetical protein
MKIWVWSNLQILQVLLVQVSLRGIQQHLLVFIRTLLLRRGLVHKLSQNRENVVCEASGKWVNINK